MEAAPSDGPDADCVPAAGPDEAPALLIDRLGAAAAECREVYARGGVEEQNSAAVRFWNAARAVMRAVRTGQYEAQDAARRVMKLAVGEFGAAGWPCWRQLL